MDLVKSMQSEDLPKDLQRNPRISPQTWVFHDEMNRVENKGDDPTQILVLRSAFRSSCALRLLSETPSAATVGLIEIV